MSSHRIAVLDAGELVQRYPAAVERAVRLVIVDPMAVRKRDVPRLQLARNLDGRVCAAASCRDAYPVALRATQAGRILRVDAQRAEGSFAMPRGIANRRVAGVAATLAG